MELSFGNSKSRYILFISIVLALLFAFIIFKPFSSKNMAINISPSCAVDVIKGANFVDGFWVATKNSPIEVAGWVSDPKKRIANQNILLELIDKDNNVVRSITEKSDFDRPDVEKAFNNPAMKFTGYNIPLGMDTKPGDYTILLGSSYPNLQTICTRTTNLRISE